jgi:hypothetical protein
MADRKLAVFGLTPNPSDKLMQELQLSSIQCDIEEAQAKLDTQRSIEQATRLILVAHYSTLSYHAGRCRDRMATRQWTLSQADSERREAAIAELSQPARSGSSGKQAVNPSRQAESNHDDMVEAIAEQEEIVRSLQAKFDAISSGKEAVNA